MGVNDEIALESWEYDIFEYFGELEHGSDSYWDARIRHLEEGDGQMKQQQQEQRSTSKKRKQGEGQEEEGEGFMSRKRRREGDDAIAVDENVVYMPFEARLARPPPRSADGGHFALLPDWKERFPEKKGGEIPSPGKGRQMPAEMRRAAEGGADDEEDEEEEGEELVEGEGMDVDSGADASGVDQDVVMQVLRQRLADSGLGEVDEAVFKDAIAQMLSGEGDGGDAVGGLASLLLGQKGGGGEAIQGFLAGQGVHMGGEEGEEDDDDDGDNDNDDDDDENNEINECNDQHPATRAAASSSAHTAASRNTRPPQTRSPAAKTATKSNLKRKAPPSPSGLSIPQTSTAATATPSTKRRRTPAPDEVEAGDVAGMPPGEASVVPGKRTTRSGAAAAAASGNKKRKS